MTLKAIDFRTCAVHGPDRIHHMGLCQRCKEEGIPAPKPAPLNEPIAAWVRRVIEHYGAKGDPDKAYAQRRMKRWRRTAKQEREARAKRWFAPIGVE